MFPIVSRRKAALIAAACSGRSGGQSRVFDRPASGVLAITPIAQVGFAEAIMASPSTARPGCGRQLAGHSQPCLLPRTGLNSQELAKRLHSFDGIVARTVAPDALSWRGKRREEPCWFIVFIIPHGTSLTPSGSAGGLESTLGHHNIC